MACCLWGRTESDTTEATQQQQQQQWIAESQGCSLGTKVANWAEGKKADAFRKKEKKSKKDIGKYSICFLLQHVISIPGMYTKGLNQNPYSENTAS